MSTQDHTRLIASNVTLEAGAEISRWTEDYAGTVVSCQLNAGTAGTGGDFIIDVKKNGTSQFSTKPQLDSGATNGSSQAATGGNTFVAGDYFSVIVVSVGAVAPIGLNGRLRVSYTGASVEADELVGSPGNLKVYGTDDAGVINWRAGRFLLKLTKVYSDFADASTSKTITLTTLPAGAVFNSAKAKHSASFTGGAVSAATLEVGISSDHDKYLVAFNVFQATGNATLGYNTPEVAETHAGAGTAITGTLTTTSANTDQLTAGSVDIWIEYSVII